MANVNIANIKAPKAPNLPIPTISYSQSYLEILTNVLRLYFNQLDRIFATLVTPDIGYYLNQPYAGFYDVAVQNAAVINTAYPISFGTQYEVDGPRFLGGNPDTFIDPGISTSAVIFLFPAVYNAAYNVQIQNTTAAAHNAWVWINRLGTALPGSVTKINIPAGSTVNVSNSFVFDIFNSEDTIQLMWATDNVGVQLVPAAATSFCPQTPTALLNITYASA
jgi:hypothetical protein